MVELKDGTVKEYTANIIAENIYSQTDSEGWQYFVLKEITNHQRCQGAVHKNDGYVISRNGNWHPKRTTHGWDLLVKWRDGQTTWVPLKDIKESNPLEVTRYAVANKIDDEPAFAWWVQTALHHQRCIIAKVQGKYWRTTHK